MITAVLMTASGCKIVIVQAVIAFALKFFCDSEC